MKMKNKKSLDVNNRPKRRKSKIHSLDQQSINKATEQQKENVEPEPAETQPPKNASKNRKTKRKKEKTTDLGQSLQANNRELATALEEARLQNAITKKQLHSERQHHIDTVKKEVEVRVQEKFKVIDNYLQQTVRKLLDCTKIIKSATELISISKAPTAVFTPNIHISACDTTPPPDMHDKMEVTTAEAIPMETTCVELGCIFTELNQLSQRERNEMGSIHWISDSSCPDQDKRVLTEPFSDTVSMTSCDTPNDRNNRVLTEAFSDVVSMMSCDTINDRNNRDLTEPFSDAVSMMSCDTTNDRKNRVLTEPFSDNVSMMSWETTNDRNNRVLAEPFKDSVSMARDTQPTPRSKRRCSVNVSYIMPKLTSKLRKGDPFTDTTFKTDLLPKNPRKRKGRMSTGCIQKKSRCALSNLTNIIKEEREDTVAKA